MYIHCICISSFRISSCTYDYGYSGLKGTILELISPRRPLKPRRKPTRKAKAQVDTCMSMILRNTFLYNRNNYYVQPHSSAYTSLSNLECTDFRGEDCGSIGESVPRAC